MVHKAWRCSGRTTIASMRNDGHAVWCGRIAQCSNAGYKKSIAGSFSQIHREEERSTRSMGTNVTAHAPSAPCLLGLAAQPCIVILPESLLGKGVCGCRAQPWLERRDVDLAPHARFQLATTRTVSSARGSPEPAFTRWRAQA